MNMELQFNETLTAFSLILYWWTWYCSIWTEYATVPFLGF